MFQIVNKNCIEYLLSIKNDLSREMGLRITKADRVSCLKSKLFSRKAKSGQYTVIIRP